MGGGQGQDPVKFGFEAASMEVERGLVPLVAPLRLVARQADEVAKSRGEDAVALVDDILRVAQEMGEADLLLFLGPAGLGAVAVGDPCVRADVYEKLLNRVLGTRRGWVRKKAFWP